MPDFIYFLGRFHVLALHLPIALILVAVLLDWVARRDRYRQLAAAAPFLWAAAALSAVLTVALGYMHFAEGGFAGPTASAHRFFGTTVAVLCVAIWWLCAHRPMLHRTINVVTGLVVLLLVTMTGHLGGNLTHGESFLWQYAPGPLKALGSGALRRPAASTAGAADAVVVSGPAVSPETPPVSADPELVDRLYRNGFLVRQVSQTDPHLVVSVYSPGARVVAQHMALLETAADQIVELNLQDAGLDDNELANLSHFTELTRLRLSRNDITDRTVASLASMSHLERLNLYANPGITDASVDPLAGLASLRRLDVWRTNITEAGVARLRELRPDLEIQDETASGVIYPIEPPPNGAR
jgi:uncharacterized membrane protein